MCLALGPNSIDLIPGLQRLFFRESLEQQVSTEQEFVMVEGCLHVPFTFSAYLLCKAVYVSFSPLGLAVLMLP